MVKGCERRPVVIANHLTLASTLPTASDTESVVIILKTPVEGRARVCSAGRSRT